MTAGYIAAYPPSSPYTAPSTPTAPHPAPHVQPTPMLPLSATQEPIHTRRHRASPYTLHEITYNEERYSIPEGYVLNVGMNQNGGTGRIRWTPSNGKLLYASSKDAIFKVMEIDTPVGLPGRWVILKNIQTGEVGESLFSTVEKQIPIKEG